MKIIEYGLANPNTQPSSGVINAGHVAALDADVWYTVSDYDPTDQEPAWSATIGGVEYMVRCADGLDIDSIFAVVEADVKHRQSAALAADK